MIRAVVAVALRAPLLVLFATLALVAGGLAAYARLDIEAYPNPVPPLVEVIAQPEGMSAEDVERYVTVPLELALAGMPGLDHVRSQSLFGLADVKCYFRWSAPYKDARQEVLNRLAAASLPAGVTASISPWNAIGEVYRYELRGAGYGARDLKTAQDWILEREFKQVPGVADVVSFGGETKQFQILVDPFRLRAQGVTLPQLMDAVARGNQNVGGQRLTIGEQAYTVRGVGLVKDVRDVDDIVITARAGVPVRVRDVGHAEIGHAPRLGVVGRDRDDDVVQGVVLMRYGGQTKATLEGIHARVEHIRRDNLLPPGMEIVPTYDRGGLVRQTTRTVLHNLVVGMGLVAVVLWAFLGHTRAAIITALNAPLALLAAFAGMVASDTPANLISLGAIDFGVVIDATVIVMENVFHHLERRAGDGSAVERVLAAAGEVGGPMASSTAILGVALLPLFAMGGVSGVIFAPMAATYAFAIGGALLLAVTLTPALAARLVGVHDTAREPWVVRAFERLDAPVYRAVARRPVAAAVLGAAPVLAALAFAPALGGEFMPKLEEGNFWIRATLPQSIALEQSARYVGRMRAIVRGCPDDGECTEENRRHKMVRTVVSQLGRPDDGTDVAGFHNVELFAPLEPPEGWPKGVTKEKLAEELHGELVRAFPGVVFNFSQVISDNVEEAVSGVKGENSVKVFGPDLRENEATARRIEDALRGVRGVADLGVLPSAGQPGVRITPDRARCSRYGLNVGDVGAVVQAAIGGRKITEVLEGDKRFDLTVRWMEPYRASIEDVRELMIPTPDGASVPLGQLAEIGIEDGTSVVYREDGQRYTPVKFSVRGRDLEGTVHEAHERVGRDVPLRYDAHLAWTGAINELREAEGRLAIVVPATLLAIAVLVYAAVRNVVDTVLVFLNIPLACAGGVLALLATRVSFSVSAAMGFVSIFGIAVQDAILVVTSFQRLRAAGATVHDAAFEATLRRRRPVLMTTLVALFGLLPAALSDGIGSQTQKPLAIVVLGGAAMLAVVARYVKPALLVLAHRRFG